MLEELNKLKSMQAAIPVQIKTIEQSLLVHTKGVLIDGGFDVERVDSPGWKIGPDKTVTIQFNLEPLPTAEGTETELEYLEEKG
jgi:hypothetical protein